MSKVGRSVREPGSLKAPSKGGILSCTSASWPFQIPGFLAAHLRELKNKHFLCLFKASFQKPRKLPVITCSSFVCPLAPMHHLSGNGYCPESVLVCSPGGQLFWAPVNPCPSCGPGRCSTSPFSCHSPQADLGPTAPIPPALLNHLSSPDWLHLNRKPVKSNCSYESKCAWIMLWDLGRGASATRFTESRYLTEWFKDLRSDSFHRAPELASIVDECLYLEGIFKNRNANVCPWF